MARVSTGEHWYGTRALELKLVDDLKTSDDYLLAASKSADIYEVSYVARKGVSERVLSAMQAALDSVYAMSWRGTEHGRAM